MICYDNSGAIAGCPASGGGLADAPGDHLKHQVFTLPTLLYIHVLITSSSQDTTAVQLPLCQHSTDKERVRSKKDAPLNF